MYLSKRLFIFERASAGIGFRLSVWRNGFHSLPYSLGFEGIRDKAFFGKSFLLVQVLFSLSGKEVKVLFGIGDENGIGEL